MTQSVGTGSAPASEPGLPAPKECRRLREAAALTYEDVAAAVDVARGTVRSWESGRTVPRGRKRTAYAQFLARLAAAEPSAAAAAERSGPPFPDRAGTAVPADGAGAAAQAEPAGTEADATAGGSTALRAIGAVRAFASGSAARPVSPRTRPRSAAKRAAKPPVGMPRHEVKTPARAGVGAGIGAGAGGHAGLRPDGSTADGTSGTGGSDRPGAPPPPGTAEHAAVPRADGTPCTDDATGAGTAEAAGAHTRTGPDTRAGAGPEAWAGTGPEAGGPEVEAGPGAWVGSGAEARPGAWISTEAEARPRTGFSTEAEARTGTGDGGGTDVEAGTGGGDGEGPGAVPQGTRQGRAAEAFDALHAHAAHTLVRQTYLLTGRRALALEAVERAFCQAWARWPEVAVDPAPVGWVRAAAYEYALSPWHRLRRSHRHPDKPPVEPDDRILLDAMLALPPAHRRTVLLYDGVGLDLPDTAAETEASTPTAGSRLLHAHADLADRIPELADVPPEKQSALLHARFAALRPAVRLEPRPGAVVRTGAERRTRLWTRATVGLTAVIAAATAYTAVTAPTHYEPPRSPGASVSGVPPLSGPQRLTEQSRQLQDKLRADPAAGPGRLAPLSE
ncbi:helix-turn-helix domain-containing protein [Streptomyces sp. NPDC055254]